MALTGKTIGQLTYLSGVTTDTLFPVELSGDTFHIAYSAFTNSNYNTGTYDELYSYATGGTLSAGSYYLMTDYQTCYDQPLYDSTGTPITTGNYKTGTTETILLLATSTTGFSPTVFSTLYPNDKITYDITWNTTEVTSSPAKGRITERIDTVRNNRTDYDFRAVQFKRYFGYFSENLRQGTVSLDATSQPAQVLGVGTAFDSNFSVGEVFGIFYPDEVAPIGCIKYYEITSIVDGTEMYVSGLSYNNISNAYYTNAYTLTNYSSPFPPNVTGGTNDESAEYYTFDQNENDNTYIGDNNPYTTFILSNNVFLFNSAYENITFGNSSTNNTFTDPSSDNTMGSYFRNNIITNNFRRNSSGPFFQNNIIEADMLGNRIGNYFQYNTIGDNDGQDFNYNLIGGVFSNNYLTMANSDFQSNNIGYDFSNNIVDSGFFSNTVSGRFRSNFIYNSNFETNIIEDFFQGNKIPVDFNDNKISATFYNNNIYSTFTLNTIGENGFNNTFGDPNSIATYSFTQNIIGSNFTNNYFSGTTQGNTIGYGCDSNNIDTNFSQNQIGNGFASNTIANDFGFGGGFVRGNIVGNGFSGNIVEEYCYDNTFGDNCTNNNLGTGFTNNNISNGMNGVITTNFDNPLDTFQNNTIAVQSFTGNLTLSGGTGGNPNLYLLVPTTITLDANDSLNYVTFLSAGTYVAQTVTI